MILGGLILTTCHIAILEKELYTKGKDITFNYFRSGVLETGYLIFNLLAPRIFNKKFSFITFLKIGKFIFSNKF